MTLCSIEGCETTAKYKGLCGMHYKRQWRHGDPNKTLTPTKGFALVKCIAEEGCEEWSKYSCGLCEAHYQMQRVYGRTYKIVRRGESYIDSNGYVRTTINGQMRYEHVVMAEKALGKPLPTGAVVHHTGGKSNNHGFLKLILCPSQDYHLLLHRRAKELGYENN